MKKTKLEERIKNAVEAFFEDGTSKEFSALTVAGNQELTFETLPSEQLAKHADKYFGYFKKIFSFVPGALFLHLFAPATIIFGSSLWSLFFLAAGFFMVWAGIGDLKNKTHFLIPLSVVLTATIFALPFNFLTDNLSNYYVYFYIGILPLLFIAPILTKQIIDKSDKNSDSV